MADSIHGTMGAGGSNNVIGKDIRMTIQERDEKLTEVWELCYKTSERVAVLETYFRVAAVVLVIVAFLVVWKVF
jgi:hypothetical protein